jgi:D-alanyl-D-alanine carboxypeptidase-like protein
MVAVPVATSSYSTVAPFVATVAHVSRADLRWSWRPGCPVGPSQLRRIRLRYMGFDGKPHVGTIVVNANVTAQVTAVFRRLYAERFPIRSILPIDVFHGSDSASTAADNTSSFNCRFAVASGPKHWSMHAYGEAVDINTVENPYIQNGVVSPANAKAFADRTNIRPGMAVEHGVLVQAFARAGWSWGGRWSPSPDYQHFSTNGH